ncbi:TPA: acyl-CoA synthetase, partial [Aeromonas hydrophila]|nr:acyl-CoA synthetase [Aeromonas hydrophila]
MTLLQTIWQRDGERVVAFGPDGEVTLAELRRGSLQLARAMARLAGPDRPSMRWALCFDDSLLFAQALLACALGGHRAILPGHQRLAGLQALQSQFDGLLTDGELPGAALTAV